MDAIKAARELGKAIQIDNRFIAYNNAKLNNDGDEELQNLIGEFNLTKQNLQAQLSKEEKEQSKIDELNQNMQEQYRAIMSNENMAAFTVAKAEVDELIRQVNGIISMCCDGADPETCEPSTGCGSGCSSCAGCGDS
ncbi:MAG: YlbF family regulator [Oscillospiraceae bacterium]|nr:YlbF family regulator [Oscillospiraceae bacterium]